MGLIQKLKHLAAGAVVAGSLAVGAPQANAGGSLEVGAGHKSSTLDLKLNNKVGPKTNLFLRNKLSLDYKTGNPSYFGLADLNQNIVGGLGAVGEVQVGDGIGVVPRAGLSYFRKFGPCSVYGQGTVKLGKNPDGEVVVNVGCNPKLSKDLELRLNAENITNFGRKHNFSVQRFRAGLGQGNGEVGIGTDVTEAGGKVGYNVLGYLKYRF